MILQSNVTQPLNVAIYCRLSIDDGNAALESLSISNQKEIITKYVKERGWHIYQYYTDDGFSGTNFDRPGFQEMLIDIERGKIDTVVTKDLSRLGRDYLKTGFYIQDYFPDHNIRYIAISDNVDSFDHEDDFVPFKNIINEMYAKDVSKKIRFTITNQMKNGKDLRTAIPLYGYMFDKDNKRVPDPVTAPIVQLIYEKFCSGMTYSEIGRYLAENKIMTPVYYNYQKYGFGSGGTGELFTADPYKWNHRTISRMLCNDEYIGVFRRGKSTRKFKSKKDITIPKNQQYIFEDRYPPLVSKEQFREANSLVSVITNKKKSNYSNRYAGLVFCGVCGKRMGHKVDERVNRADFVRLKCKKHCSENCGTILYDDLDKIIKKEIMALKTIILKHKDYFMKLAQKASHETLKSTELQHGLDQKDLLEANITKIDFYIKKVFEQYSNGLIPESSYTNMVVSYTKEKEDLRRKIMEVDEIIDNEKNITPDYVRDSNDMLKNLMDLNPATCLQEENLRKIIFKIYVKTDGVKKRREKMNKEVTIVYKYVDPIIKEFLENAE